MKPIDLLTNDVILSAIRNDKNCEVELLSWKTKNFTKIGDNYASFVTSIEAEISINGIKDEVYYIAKLNPCRTSECWNVFNNHAFKQEIEFLTQIKPMLSSFIKSNEKLAFPKCYYSSTEKDKELIITEDLRKKGFKMVSKKSCLDYAHASLVMNELAKFHASGYLLSKKHSVDDIFKMFPILSQNNLLNNSLEEFIEMLRKVIEDQADLSIKLLEFFPGYEKVISWIQINKKNLLNILQNQIKITNSCFDIITHGDCWNNNLLFR